MLRPLISLIAYRISSATKHWRTPAKVLWRALIAKDTILCILSAVLLILPFCNGNLWIFAWFGFVPVFLALNNKSRKEAFFLFFITGLIFWSGTIYWLIHVTLPGTVPLIIYLALYFALFGLIIRPFTRNSTPLTLIFVASVWVLLEYIRSHLFTGFPWALLGNSQYLNLPVIQIADITGVWGVSFLIMLVNLTVYSLIAYRLSSATEHWRTPAKVLWRALIAQRKNYLIVFLLLAAVLSYGYYKIYQLSTINYQLSTKVSVIQGNIPQELKWDPDPRAKYFIIDRYLSLSSRALKDRPDLIIWPEASLPVVAEEEPSFLEVIKDFAEERKVNLLLGAVTTKDNLYYNSAILVSKTGVLSQQYDKLHLVPFGEYIPLKDILPFLQAVVPIGEIVPGQEYTVFTLNAERRTQNAGRFAVLICFEDLFPEISRRFVKDGARFLVNITNDAWYKETSAPYQHLQASVLRAVENRVYLARAANTGVSGFINPAGRIISLARDNSGRTIFIEGYKTQGLGLSGRKGLTFYSRYGDIFILLTVILAACGLAPCALRRR